jgi:CMP/dCMP kinase
MLVIAIDGPAGAGKSTIAAAVADALGAAHLDTGAMYRAVAYAALRDDVDPADADAVARLARTSVIESGARTVVDGVDVTDAIREPDVTVAVSAVAAIPAVREELVAQ